MKVIAAAGLKVPMEHDPRQYIDDATAVELDISYYYLRRLADGDLVEAPAEPTKKPGRAVTLVGG